MSDYSIRDVGLVDLQAGLLDHDVDPKQDYLILQVGLLESQVGLLESDVGLLRHLYLKTHNTRHTLIMRR